MAIKLFAVALAIVGISLVACGGRSVGGSSMVPSGATTYTLPGFGSAIEITAKLPKDTIGEELQFEGVGSLHSKKWDAEVGGFTQTERSQVLAFPPGTKITIRNLSTDITHTLDVVKEVKGPPAKFPANPNLSIPKKGGDKLETGYASGPIKPGDKVTVVLAKPGVYLIGCAIHYVEYHMRDVLVVKKGAKPGPQATPTPRATPTSHSSYAPVEQ